MKRQYIYLAVLVGLLAVSWRLGSPTVPPPAKVANFPKVEGSVAGVSKDLMPPVSRFIKEKDNVKKGDILRGEASDLGSGVAEVAVQVQRSKDGAVWDGTNWSESLGSALPAKLIGSQFEFEVSLELSAGEHYIFRSQAIDYSGNAQTNWSEIEVVGAISGEIKLN